MMSKGQRVQREHLQGARSTGSNNLLGPGRGVRDRTELEAGEPVRRVDRGCGVVGGCPVSLTLVPGAPGVGDSAAPAPPTADRLPRHQGASRHAARAVLIGSSREPRPLSCSGAGFSVAAIFVDVSALRGLGEVAAEGAWCRPCYSSLPLAPALPVLLDPVMEKLAPTREFQWPL